MELHSKYRSNCKKYELGHFGFRLTIIQIQYIKSNKYSYSFTINLTECRLGFYLPFFDKTGPINANNKLIFIMVLSIGSDNLLISRNI